LSLEWNSECVMEGESGEQVGGNTILQYNTDSCYVNLMFCDHDVLRVICKKCDV